MTFSDLYLDQNHKVKVEILPGDKLIQHKELCEIGDSLILIARPLGTSFAAKRLADEFTNEFRQRLENKSTMDALVETIKAFHYSLCHPPAAPKLIPDSQCYFLAVYIDSKNKLSFVQVGDITLKMKRDDKFIALTKENKFSLGGPLEPKCQQLSDIQL